MEVIWKNIRPGQRSHIEQYANEILLVRPALSSSVFVEALSDPFIAEAQALAIGLGAGLGDIEIITPEPRSCALAATNKNAPPGTYIMKIDDPAVRNLLAQGPNSTERSWVVRIYDGKCSGMTLEQAKCLFRWLLLVNLINCNEFRTFVHDATPNDTCPLTFRVVEYIALHNVIALSPHPNPGGPTRFAVVAPPLDVDYEAMKGGRLIVQNMDFVRGVWLFRLSNRYLADKRSLFCIMCGLDWHITADCPLLALPDYNGPQGTISEFVDSVLGDRASSAAWARVRNSRFQPNLKPYSGEESPEYTLPPRGMGRARREDRQSRPLRGGSSNSAGNCGHRGRGRGRGF
ncbi:hypothetical protein PM082_000691 [Marasmius tenuissimus]|nr:hypothetical protein PM082_000691 [Marasmius tenuissimus]